MKRKIINLAFISSLVWAWLNIIPSMAQDPRDIPTNTITSIAWSPDGTKMATANNGGSIQVWDALSQILIQTLATPQPNPILTVAWSPDGTKLAATVDKNISVWDATTWGLLKTLEGHTHPVWSVAWRPDSTQIASVAYGGRPYNFRIWDVTTGQQIYAMQTTGYIYAVDWSVNSANVTTIGGRRVELWDLPSTQRQNTLEGQGGDLVDVEWSPDGTQIVSSGDDERVVVWDVVSGTMAHELTGHVLDIPDFVYSVDWSPDGNLVASAGSEGTVRVWAVASEEQLGVIEVPDGAYSVAFSPDGTKLVYGTTNGVFEIVPVPGVACQTAPTIAAGDTVGLINAINMANSTSGADTICLTQDSTYTFSLVHSGMNALPKITSDITIVGNGATLARQLNAAAFRFFEVSSNGTLTLDNLTLTGADSGSEPGGAIINLGSLTVNQVTFTNNHAYTGAAIDNHRFGGTSNPITATITNSTFQNNTATYGAALDNDANATMTVTNSTFTSNVAVHDGGAIRNHGVLSLTDSQILNNTASAGGSGIFSTGSTTAHNSCISGNTTTVTSVVHVGSNVQDFAGNYWGAADGPSGAGGGSGDSVNHSINIADFLTACPYSS